MRALHGLLLCVFALVSQLALGATVPASDDRDAALVQAAIQCTGDTQPDGTPAPHRHAGDLALCPLSTTLTLPAYLPASPPVLPAPPPASAFTMAARPPARGPPAPATRVGQPRAPPALT